MNFFKTKTAFEHWDQLKNDQKTTFDQDYIGQYSIDNYLYIKCFDHILFLLESCPEKLRKYLDQELIAQTFYDTMRTCLIQKGNYLFKLPNYDQVLLTLY